MQADDTIVKDGDGNSMRISQIDAYVKEQKNRETAISSGRACWHCQYCTREQSHPNLTNTKERALVLILDHKAKY